MKNNGKSPIVIGTFDNNGKVDEKIIINPGDEIPERALHLLKNAKDVTKVCQENPLNMNEVENRIRQ